MTKRASTNNVVRLPGRRENRSRPSGKRKAPRGVTKGAGKLLVIAVAAALVIGYQQFSAHAPESKAPAAHAASLPKFSGTVTRIVDGDTFYISGQKMRIRLWGVDAPEVDEAGGAAATEKLREIAGGKHLDCERIDIDKYDRPVARCYLPDGSDISRLMIESGTAEEYKYFTGGYYSRGR